MSSIALNTSASGMSALNTQLDITANNLANANTTAFKSSRANFQDLYYIEKKQPGVENQIADSTSPIGLFVGLGWSPSPRDDRLRLNNQLSVVNGTLRPEMKKRAAKLATHALLPLLELAGQKALLPGAGGSALDPRSLRRAAGRGLLLDGLTRGTGLEGRLVEQNPHTRDPRLALAVGTDGEVV